MRLVNANRWNSRSLSDREPGNGFLSGVCDSVGCDKGTSPPAAVTGLGPGHSTEWPYFFSAEKLFVFLSVADASRV